MLGTMSLHSLDNHGLLSNPAKRVCREGSLPDTDRGSSDSSPDSDQHYKRKYKSNVKAGKICQFHHFLLVKHHKRINVTLYSSSRAQLDFLNLEIIKLQMVVQIKSCVTFKLIKFWRISLKPYLRKVGKYSFRGSHLTNYSTRNS